MSSFTRRTRPPFDQLFSMENRKLLGITDSGMGHIHIEILPRNPNSFRSLDPHGHPPVGVAICNPQGGPLSGDMVAALTEAFGAQVVSGNTDTDAKGDQHFVVIPALKSDSEIMASGWRAAVITQGEPWWKKLAQTLKLSDEQANVLAGTVETVSRDAARISWPPIALPGDRAPGNL